MKKGIKTRLMVPLLVVIAVSFSGFILFLNLRLRGISQKELDARVQHVGEAAVQLARSPLFYSDYVKLVNAMAPLAGDSFDYFLVYDLVKGGLAYARDPRGVLPPDYAVKFRAGGRFDEPAGARQREQLRIAGMAYSEFVFPTHIANVQSPIGLVVIGISQRRINEQLFPITLWIMALGVATIVLVLLATYFISNRFIVPLQQLTRTLSEFTAGDTGARARIASQDEIGVLAGAYNHMADRINEQIASIETYSRDLEKMVEERSRKLVEALNELREKDIKLEQARRIRSLNSVASSIAHQINNPMAIISGHVQMIAAANRDESTARRLKSIEHSIDRIDGLIKDIGFYLALREIALEERPLAPLVLDVGRELVPAEVQAEYSGFSGTALTVRVPINIDLMRIALRNVIQNALDAVMSREADRRIWFRLQQEGEKLQLQIEDNGPGIAEPERAFDPFFSITPGRSGMGLTFAYQIIQIHAGDIHIVNTGGGTQVTIRFALRNAHSQ